VPVAFRCLPRQLTATIPPHPGASGPAVGQMGGWTSFLITYVLGGITFLPLVICAVVAHAYFTFPYRDDIEPQHDDGKDNIVQPDDDVSTLHAESKARSEESKPRLNLDSDVASGYFAVCREYTPMGINAKPIERATPVGSTTVASPSPSVYQAMYRSIFERKATPGPLDNNNNTNQRPKRAGNVFFVVLRYVETPLVLPLQDQALAGMAYIT
jgi:hypothetical protein